MHHILLLDDSRSALKALASQLDPNIFTVVTCDTGPEALAKLQEMQLDCVVTDFEMPLMNGHEFCALVKTNDKTRHLPILMLTSRAEPEHLLAGLSAGADDYLSKDTDVRIIVAKIGALIRNKHTQDEVAKLRRAAGIRQIIATYNHEFNNPLAIALGNLNMLSKSLTDPAHQARALKALEAMERMAGIVRKIRDLKNYVEENYAGTDQMVSLEP